MSLLKQQNFLAKLYTDEQLRRDFGFQPMKIGRVNDLNESEIQEIREIFQEEISFFAESLFWKRLRETEKFLPMTKEILNGDFEKLFREFSGNYHPQTIKKHLEDATEFCRFLRRSESISAIAKDVAKYEEAKLKFFGYGERFAFCHLKFDIEEIFRESAKAQKFDSNKKTKYAVWLRFGRHNKHYFF